MHTELKHTINAKLADALNLVDLNGQPHDLSTLQNRVLHLELQAEIAFLQEALATPETFAETFKQRCASRERGKEQAISFQDLPGSATNSLYWDIATLLFAPKTQQEMLSILMPGIQHQLKITFPETHEGQSVKEFLNHVTPELSVTPFDDLKESSLLKPPSLQALSRYVIAKDMLLDSHEMVNLSLPLHVSLQTTLNKHYPELAQTLYEHNHSLQTLAADISYYIDKGITPEKALTDLHKGLTLGGRRMTGQYLASSSATKAIAQFSAWFDTLPAALQNDLRAITYNGHHTLGNIVDDELNQGTCVEVAASHLISLLEHHRKNALLRLPPAITPGQLKALEKKYKGKKNTLDVQKEQATISAFPRGLTKKAINELNIQSTEDLINVLIAFPPSHYEMLWQDIKLPNPNENLNHFAKAIAQGLFNPEQKKALAQAVWLYFSKFGQDNKSILFWAVKTNDAIFLHKALENMSMEEKQLVIQQKGQYGYGILHHAAIHPQSLTTILPLYNESQKLAAIRQKDVFGDTIPHKAAAHPQCLKIILDSLRKDQKLDVLLLKNGDGNTVLHYTADNFHILETILDLLTTEQRLEAIQHKGMHDNTVLHQAITHPQSLKAILESLPKEQRLQAVKHQDGDGSFVLHQAAAHPQSLKAILEPLSKEQERLEAAGQTNRDGHTVLHLTVANPQSLKAILELLPENQRMAAVKLRNKDGDTVLHKAAANPQSLEAILDTLPKGQKQDAIQQSRMTTSQVVKKPESKPCASNHPSFFAKTDRQKEEEVIEPVVDNRRSPG